MSIEKLDFDYVKQSHKHFTTFLNEVIQNVPHALVLGVWVYLSSLPPAWNVNRQHLINHFGIGREKLGKVLKWLNDNQLLEYERGRRSDGVYTGKVAIIIKDGKDFVEQIINKKEPKSTIPEISTVDDSPVDKPEIVDNYSTTLLENHILDNPQCGESAAINKTYIINKTKEEKPSFDQKKSFSVDNSRKYPPSVPHIATSSTKKTGWMISNPSRNTVSDEFKTTEKGSVVVAEQYLSNLPWDLRPDRYKTTEYSKNF